ncbi:MAG: hypothetical protein K6F84_08380 [Lachnospiraceae bacterium]|nr:hypothetical protein [Lachnospiraceae bacterium]
MSLQLFKYAVYAFAILISLAIGYLAFKFLSADFRAILLKQYQKAESSYLKRVKRDQNKNYAYLQMKENMKKTGITYRMSTEKYEFTPFAYAMFRIALCFLAAFVGLLISPLIAVLFAFIMYLAVPLNFSRENKADNDDMLEDIGAINSILALQIKNGVFITDIIYECFRIAKNERLKKALLELSIELENSNPFSAIDNFRCKFDNQHINMFAKCIEQLEKVGQEAQFFDSLNKSISSINSAIAIKEQQRVENIGSLFETLMFLGIIVFVLYITFATMSSGVGKIFN